MKRAPLPFLVWPFVSWCLAPFAWQVIPSAKSNAEIRPAPNVSVPARVGGAHYPALFSRKPFARCLLTSFVGSGAATALCRLVSGLAAGAVARVRVRGGRLLLLGLVGVALFPSVIFFFPLSELVRLTRTANNPLALILPYVTF